MNFFELLYFKFDCEQLKKKSTVLSLDLENKFIPLWRWKRSIIEYTPFLREVLTLLWEEIAYLRLFVHRVLITTLRKAFRIHWSQVIRLIIELHTGRVKATVTLQFQRHCYISWLQIYVLLLKFMYNHFKVASLQFFRWIVFKFIIIAIKW